MRNDQGCPVCSGTGLQRAASDGYESSRTWRCDGCGGRGKERHWARHSIDRLRSRLRTAESDRDQLDRLIVSLGQQVRRAEELLAGEAEDAPNGSDERDEVVRERYNLGAGKGPGALSRIRELEDEVGRLRAVVEAARRWNESPDDFQACVALSDAIGSLYREEVRDGE